MEEEQKQDYRQHLINTIDTLIDSGVSVYELDVVNKKAIRHNYILRSKVEEEIGRYSSTQKEMTYKKHNADNLNDCYKYGDEAQEAMYKKEALQELLEEK